MARCFLHFIKSEHGLKRSIIWYGVAKTAISSKKRLEIPAKRKKVRRLFAEAAAIAQVSQEDGAGYLFFWLGVSNLGL